MSKLNIFGAIRNLFPQTTTDTNFRASARFGRYFPASQRISIAISFPAQPTLVDFILYFAPLIPGSHFKEYETTHRRMRLRWDRLHIFLQKGHLMDIRLISL